MTTADYTQLPVANTSGPAFRDRVLVLAQALASTNQSNDEPEVKYRGMLQVFDDGSKDILREWTGSAWVTLLPDLSKPYGGLAEVLSSGNGSDLLSKNNVWSARNEFDGATEFDGSADFNGSVRFDNNVRFTDNVTFDNNPGFSTPTSTQGQINTSLSGVLRRNNSYTRSPSLNSTDSFAHGLGKVPELVFVKLRFRQSFSGYDAGHELLISSFTDRSSTNNSGIAIRVDSQNIEIILASSISITSRQSRMPDYITNSSVFEFRIIVFDT